MAQSTQYSYLRVMSTLGGLTLVGVAAFLNVHHAAESEGYMSPVCVAIVALAFGSALLAPVMQALWRNRSWGWFSLALVGLLAGETYGFQLSAERLLAARDQRAQQLLVAAQPHALARENLERLREERKDECRSGYKLKCDKLKGWEDDQRAKLGLLLPPRSRSLIADSTGLPAWLVEIVPAMLFSTGLMVMGLVLVGFAAHRSPIPAVALEPVAPDPRPSAEIVTLEGVRDSRVVKLNDLRERLGRKPTSREVQDTLMVSQATAYRLLKSS